MKYKVGKMTESKVPVPPVRPCAEYDGDTIPVQKVAEWGGRSGWGEKPLEC